MTFIEKYHCLERLDQLIRLRAAGNAKQLAGKLGVSERTVYDLLDILKTLGARIEFCTNSNQYLYISTPRLNLKMDTFKGAKKIKLDTANFLQRLCLT